METRPLQTAATGRSWFGPLRITQPSRDEVDDQVIANLEAPLTYAPVGFTREGLPAGWDSDIQQLQVGQGDEDWEAAKQALRGWRQFDLPWVTAVDDTVELSAGRTFGFLSWQLGLWALNICRVVYVINEPRMFGFAYGTVGHHVLCGEERFMLEYHPDGRITFEIVKFSQPSNLLVALVLPLSRGVQRRFSRQALERLAQEVRS